MSRVSNPGSFLNPTHRGGKSHNLLYHWSLLVLIGMLNFIISSTPWCFTSGTHHFQPQSWSLTQNFVVNTLFQMYISVLQAPKGSSQTEAFQGRRYLYSSFSSAAGGNPVTLAFIIFPLFYTRSDRVDRMVTELFNVVSERYSPSCMCNSGCLAMNAVSLDWILAFKSSIECAFRFIMDQYLFLVLLWIAPQKVPLIEIKRQWQFPKIVTSKNAWTGANQLIELCKCFWRHLGHTLIQCKSYI